MNEDRSMVNRERIVSVLNGWVIVIPLAVILISDLALFFLGRPSGALLFLSWAALVPS